MDNAKENLSDQIRKYCGRKGIRIEVTAPYSSTQNGIAERVNRTLVEHARAMLAQNHVPTMLWPEAVAYACYLKNRSPTRALGDKTPEEIWTGKKPDVSTLREFGCPIWVLVPERDRHKLENKSKPYIFVGLSDESRAYRYYKEETNRVLTSRNVIFTATNLERPVEVPTITQPAEEENLGDNRQGTEETEKEIESLPEKEITPPAPSDPAPDPRRSERIAKVNAKQTELTSNLMEVILALTTLHGNPTGDEPKTVKEALEGPEREQWKAAMDAEMEQLKKLGTYRLIKRPGDRKPVSCKWVFKKSRNTD
jgi:hypothetical protein